MAHRPRRPALVAVVLALAACPSPPPSPPSPSPPEAAPAAAPVRRWVAVPTVPVTSPRGALAGRLPGGAVVQVRLDGERATLVGARLQGTVPVAALSSTPVVAATFQPRLEAALRQRDPDEARRVGEAMLALEPGHPAALEVVGALLTTSDWRRSRALLQRRGPRPTATLPDPPAVVPGPAFVVASSLKLRQKPGSDGRFVADLPIGTAVVVEAVEDGWARVRVPPPAGATVVLPRTILDPGTSSSPSSSTPPPSSSSSSSAPPADGRTGFVAAPFLSTSPPAVAALVAEADAATTPTLRSAWLQRALALAPCDVGLRDRAIAAALDAGLFVEAAWDSHAPVCAAATTDVPAVLAGCRGRPDGAVVVDFGAPLPDPATAPDLCVRAFERTTCFPAGEARSVAIEAARALEQRMDELGIGWDDEPTGPHADEVKERRVRVKALWDAFDAEDARLTKTFKEGVAVVDAAVGVTPWLDVSLPSSSSLWLVVQGARVHPDAGLETDAPRAFRLPPLTTTPEGSTRTFVPLPVSTNGFVGVVEAADQATAMALLASAPVPGHDGATRGEAPTGGRVIATALLPLEVDCEAQACWH